MLNSCRSNELDLHEDEQEHELEEEGMWEERMFGVQQHDLEWELVEAEAKQDMLWSWSEQDEDAEEEEEEEVEEEEEDDDNEDDEDDREERVVGGCALWCRTAVRVLSKVSSKEVLTEASRLLESFVEQFELVESTEVDVSLFNELANWANKDPPEVADDDGEAEPEAVNSIGLWSFALVERVFGAATSRCWSISLTIEWINCVWIWVRDEQKEEETGWVEESASIVALVKLEAKKVGGSIFVNDSIRRWRNWFERSTLNRSDEVWFKCWSKDWRQFWIDGSTGWFGLLIDDLIELNLFELKSISNNLKDGICTEVGRMFDLLADWFILDSLWRQTICPRKVNQTKKINLKLILLMYQSSKFTHNKKNKKAGFKNLNEIRTKLVKSENQFDFLDC